MYNSICELFFFKITPKLLDLIFRMKILKVFSQVLKFALTVIYDFLQSESSKFELICES